MEDTFNFYIDKNKNNKYNTELSVIPHHPIINDQDDSKITIKLCDFKFLNTFYNISSTLVNNQFNIRKTSKTYTYTFGNELYLSETGFFDESTNNLLVSEVISTTDNTSKITYGDLTLLYFNNNDITDDTQSYWQNILKSTTDGANRKLELIRDLAYLEFETTNNEIITNLYTSFYKDSYTGDPVDVDVIFERFNTITDQYAPIDSTTLTFNSAGAQETETYTFQFTNPVATGKYRLRITTSSLPFNIYITRLQGNKQIPVFDNGTIDAPVENTITIPDGFYKASNFRKKLNELLTSYKITVSIDEYTNKIKFTNDNTTFTPSINDLIDENFKLDLVIPNNNMKDNLGITLNSYQTYIPIPFNSYYESDTHINLMNFTKIIITTNLSFKHKTHNDILNNANPYCKSFGNILTWLDSDEIPFSCIKYKNYENIEYEIVNDHINYISFRFFNENSQELQLDNCLMHFQIKKEYFK
jgi:hypothetical protein